MADDAKSLIRRFYEELSQGNLDAIDELIADDMIEHEETPGLVQMIDIVRVRDGQASRALGVTDAMALMQQLGAIPEEAPA